MGGTTGVSLEQGLGLTDISRGRPGRRPGGERSALPDYYFIIDKINPSSIGTRLICPLSQFLVPRSTGIGTRPLAEKQDHTFATCVFLFLDALPRHLENSFGF